METTHIRSKLVLPLVAVVAFVLGGGSVLASIALLRLEVRASPGSSKVRADITVLKSALDSYAMNNGGKYPASLAVLVTPDSNGHRYLNQQRLPLDPWKREYCYVPGSPPNVTTLGADGKPGGTGDDADIDYVSFVNGR